MSYNSTIVRSNRVLPSGARLNDNYEIEAFIKAGGMGEVYKAHEIATGDLVAIKVIRDELADDEAMLALFRNEAQAMRRIHHPAIVRYFGFSLDPTLHRHYLARECVEGISLLDMLEHGPLSVEATATLTRRLADGLQAAHDCNVVHRDMAPDNVIVPEAGLVGARIIDFGIARSTRAGDATVIGDGFAGKHKYVSPEQLGAFGGGVYDASDVYSLGLVLAQCLLGQPLNMGVTEFDAIKRRETTPDLSGVDMRFRPLLERMLQPNPADRAGLADISLWAARIGQGDDSTVIALSGARWPATPSSAAQPPIAAAKKEPIAARVGGALKRYASALRLSPKQIAIVSGLIAVCAGGYALWPMASGYFASHPAPEPVATQSEASPPEKVVDTALATRIGQFIRDFDGGECFLASATEIAPGHVTIDGFGANKSTFEALDSAFKAAQGFDADINAGEITRAQCPALAFAKRFPKIDDALRIDIGRARLKRTGDLLEGVVEIVSPYAHIGLFIVDTEGGVHEVTSRMSEGKSRRAFAMQLRAPRPSPLLIFAVASTEPITGVRTEHAASEEAFRSLMIALAPSSRPGVVVAKYLKLE